jgi:hypothetical protein
VHADGQKDRHDEANSDFSQFCEKHITIHTILQLFRFCVAEICLCVLQTAFGSFQSADCDTEWLIGINVVTGVFLCAADSIWFFTVS